MEILIPAIAALLLMTLYKRIRYGGRTMIDKETAKKLIEEENALFLDVRTEMEYQKGSLPGSTLMPFHTIRTEAAVKFKDKDQPIIVFCETGTRSMKAAKMFEILGYTRVYDLGSRENW